MSKRILKHVEGEKKKGEGKVREEKRGEATSGFR